MFSLKNQWRAVEVAGWTALALGIASVAAFTAVTGRPRTIAPPSLLYPYFAATSVFVVTCVWILLEARAGTRPMRIDSNDYRNARRWAFSVFAGLTVLFSLGGLAGREGENAIRAINGYLFGIHASSPTLTRLGLPFGFISAAGNALALATLAYLGFLCNALVLSASRSRRRRLSESVGSAALLLSALGQQLQRYLVMSSALAVTSTLTLYLFFGVAEQLQRETTSADPSPRWSLVCSGAPGKVRQYSCDVAPPRSDKTVRHSSAAYMAMVCGVAFTGVLFVLFYSCGSALESELMHLATEAHRQRSDSFSIKTFKERYGLGDAGQGGGILQAVALAAPALTGLLTLLTT